MNPWPFARTLWHFLTVFVFRHWLSAFLNAALTALLGLGLLRAVRTLGWPRLSPLTLLQLRRLVLLVAMLKGAFYLLHGTAARNMGKGYFGLGVQFPSPWQWVGLDPMSPLNIWHPTTATALVTTLLSGFGGTFLVWRVGQLLVSQRQLHAFVHLERAPMGPRIPLLSQKAARALGMSARTPLPQVVLVELPCPTPLLLGLRRPSILLSPRLADALTDTELEMALRHELAHYLRRDQWWRWMQTWLEDVGRLVGLSRFLGTRALALEEEICDRMAARSAGEVLALAQALTKSLQPLPTTSDDLDMALPKDVVPALLGRHTRTWNEATVLIRRLVALSAYAAELSGRQAEQAERQVAQEASHRPAAACSVLRNAVQWTGQGTGWLFFGLLLALILYAKVHFVVGHF